MPSVGTGRRNGQEILCAFGGGGCIVSDTMPDDAALLQGFVADRSERAFAQLVERHLGMVFATALRRVGGDTHLAEDIAQSVFVDLARRAPALRHVRILGGWLHTSTVYAAAKAVRREQRRRRREEQAHAMRELHVSSPDDAEWTRVGPVLDDALSALSARDRDAILLRFFQNQGYAAIGATLNLTESAARMRVDRALDKLRGRLARHGIVSTASALGGVLAAHAAIAPPATLAATVTTTALAGASGAGLLAGAFNLFAMTKVQIALVAAVATTGVATIAVQQQERATLADVATRRSRVAQETQQVRADIAHLEQTAADYTALRARSDELVRTRRAAAELRERLARLEAGKPPAVPVAPGARLHDARSRSDSRSRT